MLAGIAVTLLMCTVLLYRRELVWYYQDGASHIFPDAWEKFVEPIPVVSCTLSVHF